MKNYGATNSQTSYEALIAGGYSSFGAQLGGYRSSDGGYDDENALGHYWSNTPTGGYRAYTYYFHNKFGKVFRVHYLQTQGRSVRCVRD